MNRHDEAHAACLNMLHDHPESAYRIAELCAFTRALGEEIDHLRAELAACAAGPWRTDVENAEFVDQQEYWLEYTHPWYATEPDANYRGALEYDADGDHFMHPCHGIVYRGRIVAFAIPNPPEVKP